MASLLPPVRLPFLLIQPVPLPQDLPEESYQVVIVVQIHVLVPNLLVNHTIAPDVFLLFPTSASTQPVGSPESLVVRKVSGYW